MRRSTSNPPAQSPSLLSRAISVWLLAPLACSSGGDGGNAPLPTAANIAIASGNGQSGVITLPLSNPLVVAVTDANGDPVSGFTVQWSTAEGTIAASSRTGADGRATADWTLGATSGAVTATAGNPILTGSTKSVTFNATAIGASAAAVAGDNQAGVTQTVLPNPLIVELRDANNNPVPGKAVNWGSIVGGGSVNPTSTVSGTNGRAQTAFTPGCTVGGQSVNATVSGFTGSPVTFNASVALGSGSAEVDVNDNSFSPTSATICAGQQVNWTWRGGNQHNVTFDAGGPNSATQTTGTFSRTFPAAGTFTYVCTIHGSSMSGTVVVQ